MIQFFYRVIYSPAINSILRNLNKLVLPVIPKKVKIPPSGILTIKNDQGKILKLATNQTNYLTHLLFWEGGFKKFEYTGIFISMVKKIKTFYDIGANIGYYSLLAALENPSIRVVGFEPAEGPLYYFRKNVKLNGFTNITIMSDALSDAEGEIDFYEVRNKKYKYLQYNLAGESNAGSKTKGRDYKVNKVKAVTLDSFVIQNQEEQIDLIKMDTEGTEHFILQKAHTVLAKMKPIIICETLFNMAEIQLEKIFKSYGYEFYNHLPGGLKKVSTIIRKEDDGVRNCFFVHPSKQDLIAEYLLN